MLLCCFVQTRRGEVTGTSFIDSTPIEVCHPCRSKSDRVFEGLVGWGKNSVGWHYGFKLHLIINERGELLAFKLTPGNVDDRKPVPDLTQDLIGQLFGAPLAAPEASRLYFSGVVWKALWARARANYTVQKEHVAKISPLDGQDSPPKTFSDRNGQWST